MVTGKTAFLYTVAQTAAGVEFRKWVLLTGDKTQTIMVTGTFPQQLSEQLAEPTRRAVLSIVRVSEEPKNPFEGLIFRVSPTERLKLAGRLGPTLLLTESGSPGPQGASEPLYVVGNSFSDYPSSGLVAFAQARAEATTSLAIVRIVDGRSLLLDGLTAYEIRATATHRRSGEQMSLYQVVVMDRQTYFLIQGMVAAIRADELLPEFRRVTQTFRRIPQ